MISIAIIYTKKTKYCKFYYLTENQIKFTVEIKVIWVLELDLH